MTAGGRQRPDYILDFRQKDHNTPPAFSVARACNFRETIQPMGAIREDPRFAVLISANVEWRVVKPLFPAAIHTSPFGEYFLAEVAHEQVLFFHGGWGKVSAASSTQYVIDHFHPTHLINLGTCAGVEGRVRRFDVVVPDKVVIYDIAEAIGDSGEAIAEYTTTLRLPMRLPAPVHTVTMYSADRDLTAASLRRN